MRRDGLQASYEVLLSLKSTMVWYGLHHAASSWVPACTDKAIFIHPLDGGSAPECNPALLEATQGKVSHLPDLVGLVAEASDALHELAELFWQYACWQQEHRQTTQQLM